MLRYCQEGASFQMSGSDEHAAAGMHLAELKPGSIHEAAARGNFGRVRDLIIADSASVDELDA